MLVVYQAAYQTTVEQEVVYMLFELAIQSDDFQPEKCKGKNDFLGRVFQRLQPSTRIKIQT